MTLCNRNQLFESYIIENYSQKEFEKIFFSKIINTRQFTRKRTGNLKLAFDACVDVIYNNLSQNAAAENVKMSSSFVNSNLTRMAEAFLSLDLDFKRYCLNFQQDDCEVDNTKPSDDIEPTNVVEFEKNKTQKKKLYS